MFGFEDFTSKINDIVSKKSLLMVEKSYWPQTWTKMKISYNELQALQILNVRATNTWR